jgi:hypothetical protein
VNVLKKLRRALREARNSDMRWPGLYDIQGDLEDVIRVIESTNATGAPIRWRPASEPVDTERASVHYGLVLAYSPTTGELGPLEPHAFQGVTLAPVTRGRVEWWAYLDEIPVPCPPGTGMIHGIGFQAEHYAPDFLARIRRAQSSEM